MAFCYNYITIILKNKKSVVNVKPGFCIRNAATVKKSWNLFVLRLLNHTAEGMSFVVGDKNVLRLFRRGQHSQCKIRVKNRQMR